MICKSGEIVEYSTMLSWLTFSDAYQQFFEDAREQAVMVAEVDRSIEVNNQTVAQASSSYAAALQKLKNRRK